MITNIHNNLDIESNYNQGLLPQRNQKNVFYSQTSCRSNLSKYLLSSENRRILRKIEDFSYERVPLSSFDYTPEIQKNIHHWIKGLGWDFPTSSIRTVFTHHIFNYIYIWKNQEGKVVAYSVCLFTDQISHIAYVFYNPEYSHSNLPIGMVLQVIADSYQLKLKYCYLGRFSEDTGYYKRNMPGFEYYINNMWKEFNK